MSYLNFSFCALVMTSTLAAMALLASPAVQAQALRAAPTAAAAAAQASLAADQVVVIEDDGARIEETRRRGQVVHVQVLSKVGNVRSYGIALKPSAEPASQQRGVSGRSAWHVFSF